MQIKHQQILGAFLVGVIATGSVLQLLGRIKEAVPKDTGTIEATYQEQLTEKHVIVTVLLKDGKLIQMELEEYLIGVILAEMPTTFETAALESQAVVARTYALKRCRELRHTGGAICADSTCCQAYVSTVEYLDGLGYQEDVDIAAAAVNATAGLVLTYEKKLAEATYFHSSGGRTEDAVSVWGEDYPYLQTVESPGEEDMEHYSAQVYYDKEELEQLLNISLSGTPKSWLGWTTYTTGGGVNTIVFAGMEYSGVQFRKLLKLNSTAFSIQAEEKGITISTLGKGHRVGMSQCGAQAMAMNGATCEEILSHYYPGTRIDKIDDVG